jgi:uncharacterized protein YkwD
MNIEACRARAVLIAAGVLAALLPMAPGSVRAQEGQTRARPRAAAALPVALRGHPNLLAVAGAILAATNQFRSKHGRGELKVDTKLVQAARDFAAYMAKTGNYGHTADGRNPAERVKQHGYRFCGVAENIAYAYSSADFSRQALADEFMQGWIHSPPHRKNLLEPAVTDIGIAVARSAKTGYYYAVQDFGRPLAAAVRFTIVNRSTEPLTYRVNGMKYSLRARAVRTHEECRGPQLELLLPSRDRGSRPKEKTFRPTSGERFVVSEDGKRVSVREP